MRPSVELDSNLCLLSRGVRERCLSTDCCAILTDTKSRLRSLGMRQSSSLDGPSLANSMISGGRGIVLRQPSDDRLTKAMQRTPELALRHRPPR